eukprot:c8013_g1_i1.p1 GENE.c8013_g1_i1~~c8013_g1_i1.p1  ORF type:complete len:1776 (+),score=294.39 c8013_g1_i1:24-5351(+)
MRCGHVCLVLLLAVLSHCAPSGRPVARRPIQLNSTQVHDFEGNSFKNLLYQPLIRAPILGAISGAVAPLFVGAGSSDQSSSSFDVGNEGSPSNDATRGAVAGFAGASLGSIIESVMRTTRSNEAEAKKSGAEQVTKGLGRMSVSGVAGASAGALVGVLSQSSNPPNFLQSVASGAVGALAGEAIYEASNDLFQKLDKSMSTGVPSGKGLSGPDSVMAVLPICRVIRQPNENGDGQVEIQEFLSAFDKTGDKELTINEVLAMFDIDSDGSLSESEVARAKEWFEQADKNGDGVLDAKELSDALDSSGDGSISVQEVARKLFGNDDLDKAANWVANLPLVDEWTSGLVGRLELTVPPHVQLDMTFMDRLPVWEPHAGDDLNGDAKCMFAHSSMNYKRLFNEQSRAFEFRSEDIGWLRLNGDPKSVRLRLAGTDGKVDVREIADILEENPDEIDRETLQAALDLDGNGFFSLTELIEVAGVSRDVGEAVLTGLRGEWQVEVAQICSTLRVPYAKTADVFKFLIDSDSSSGLEAFQSFMARTTTEAFFNVYATETSLGSSHRDTIDIEVLNSLGGDWTWARTDIKLTKADIDLNGDKYIDAKELALALSGDVADKEALIAQGSLDHFEADGEAQKQATELLLRIPILSVPCCLTESATKAVSAELRSFFDACESQADLDECGMCLPTGPTVTLGAVLAGSDRDAKQISENLIAVWKSLSSGDDYPISCDQIRALFDKDGGGTVDVEEFKLALQQFQAQVGSTGPSENLKEKVRVVFERLGSEIMIKTNTLLNALLSSSTSGATFADVLRLFGDSDTTHLSFQETQNARSWFDFTAMPRSKSLMALFETLAAFESAPSQPAYTTEDLEGATDLFEKLPSLGTPAFKTPTFAAELPMDFVEHAIKNLDSKLASLKGSESRLNIKDPNRYFAAWSHAYCPNSARELTTLKSEFLRVAMTDSASTRIFKSLPIQPDRAYKEALASSKIDSSENLARVVDELYDNPTLEAVTFASTFVRDVVLKNALFDPKSLPRELAGRFWQAFLSVADGIVDPCSGSTCDAYEEGPDVLTMQADMRLPSDGLLTEPQCRAFVQVANDISTDQVPLLLDVRAKYCSRVTRDHFESRKLSELHAYLSSQEPLVGHCARISGQPLQLSMWSGLAQEVLLSAYFPQSTRQAKLARFQAVQALDPNHDEFVSVDEIVKALGVSVDTATVLIKSICKGLDEGQCSEDGLQARTDILVDKLLDGARELNVAQLSEKLQVWDVHSSHFEAALTFSHVDDPISKDQLAVVLASDKPTTSEMQEISESIDAYFEELSAESGEEEISIRSFVSGLDKDRSGTISIQELLVLYGSGDDAGSRAQGLAERLEMLRMAPEDVVQALRVIDSQQDDGLTATKFGALAGDNKPFEFTKRVFAHLGVTEKTEILDFESITSPLPELAVPDLARVLLDVSTVDIPSYKVTKSLMSKLARTVRVADLREFLDPDESGITAAALANAFPTTKENHELLGSKPSISFDDFAQRVDPSGMGFATLESLSRAIFDVSDSPEVRDFTARVHRAHGAVNLVNQRPRRDHRLRDSCPEQLKPLCGNEPSLEDKNLLVLASLLSPYKKWANGDVENAVTAFSDDLEGAKNRLRAMGALSIPTTIARQFSIKNMDSRAFEGACAQLREGVQSALDEAGIATTPEAKRQFMSFSVYLEQARLMGSNQVLPPLGAPWMQRWSYFQLSEMPSCPPLYPEFGARVAAMYKLPEAMVESPKVDFNQLFDDDTLTNIAKCISSTSS